MTKRLPKRLKVGKRERLQAYVVPAIKTRIQKLALEYHLTESEAAEMLLLQGLAKGVD